MLSKNKIKDICALHLPKNRKLEKLFFAEGPKIVDEFLHSDFKIKEIYALPSWIKATSDKGLKISTEIVEITENELNKISLLQTPNQVLAIIEVPEIRKMQNWDFLLDELTLVLDTIQDPGNLGAIIRIADWFGIKNIIASPNTVDFYNPKVVQSAMGSLKRINFFSEDLQHFFSKIPQISVYGAVLNGENIYSKNLRKTGIIVLGNESKGISTEIQKFITDPILIPFFNPEHAESLNVSVATGIICAEFRRQNMMNINL